MRAAISNIAAASRSRTADRRVPPGAGSSPVHGRPIQAEAGQIFAQAIGITPPRILQDVSVTVLHLIWGILCLQAYGVSLAVILTTSAVLTAVMGIVNLLSSVIPALRDRVELLRTVLPLAVRHGAHLAAALAGFALLVMAMGLWRRKRVAWVMTLALLMVTAVSHLVKGLDWEEASGALLLAVVLVILRDAFHARSDRPSIRQGLIVTGAAFLFTLAYGVIGFYQLDQHFKVDFGFVAAIGVQSRVGDG